MIRLFDTHTHFDEPVFDASRAELAQQAYTHGVEHIVLVGYQTDVFARTLQVASQLNAAHALQQSPYAHVALGLHPVYLAHHTSDSLQHLEQALQQHPVVALGEIGIDRFVAELKTPEAERQQHVLLHEQLHLAVSYDKPVLLHVRKAYAQTIALLKNMHFKQGGIAHAFGGGVEEAKQLVRMGFKLGITGLVTHPNARKLIEVIAAVGEEHLVLETDCPDMLPWLCRQAHDSTAIQFNHPANITYILEQVVLLLQARQPQLQAEQIAMQLYNNAWRALRLPIPLAECFV